MNKTILSIKNLHKSFDKEIFRGFNLEIQDGEFVCIMGRSGCGKSLLLRLISSLEKLDKGKILFEDKEISEPSLEIGLLFQEYNLLPWLSVYQNITFGIGKLNFLQKEIDIKVNKLLKEFKIIEYKDSFPAQISGGTKQRVALARTLIMDPKLILLDEPFSALDYYTKQDIYKVITDIHKKYNKTILMVTHDPHEAKKLGNRVVEISTFDN